MKELRLLRKSSLNNINSDRNVLRKSLLKNNQKDVNAATFTKRMIRSKRVQLSRQMVSRQSVYRFADTQCENVGDLRRCHEMHDRTNSGWPSVLPTA